MSTDNEHTSQSEQASSLPMSPLGAAGPEVSRLALGAMTFAVETSEEVAFAQLDTFVEAGGTFIDTADVYADGESEAIIGRWLADRSHDHLIISTKGRFAPPAGSAGASRRSLVRSVDASLTRLAVEAIDVYFVHGWDQHTPIAETLDTLSTLVREGKIHNLAWSNITGWQLATIITTAKLSGFVNPVAVQPQYNLLDRGIEVELLPCCIDEGLALTPWSPLAGGWLTGKYTRDLPPSGPTRLGEDPNRGVEAYDTRNNAHTWAVLDVVADIADRHHRAMSHVAIAWLLTRPTVSSVLLGARTLEQLKDNLAASSLQLSDGELDRLDKASAPGLPPYPYGMLEDFCDVPHWQRLGTAG